MNPATPKKSIFSLLLTLLGQRIKFIALSGNKLNIIENIGFAYFYLKSIQVHV